MKRIIGWILLVIIANVLFYMGKYVYKKALDTEEIIAYTNLRDEIKESKAGKENPNISQDIFAKITRITNRNTKRVYWFNTTQGEFCGRIEEDGKNMITVICNDKDCARFVIRKSKNNYFLYDYEYFEFDPNAECYPFIVNIN